MRWGLLAANVVVLLLLPRPAVVAAFERAARQAVYGENVRVAVRTGAQEAVLTGGSDRRAPARPLPRRPAAGQLRDENRYH